MAPGSDLIASDMYDIGPSIDFGFEPAIYRVAQSCVIARIPRARCIPFLYFTYIFPLYLSVLLPLFLVQCCHHQPVEMRRRDRVWMHVQTILYVHFQCLDFLHFHPFDLEMRSSMKQKCKDWKSRGRGKKYILHFPGLPICFKNIKRMWGGQCFIEKLCISFGGSTRCEGLQMHQGGADT